MSRDGSRLTVNQINNSTGSKVPLLSSHKSESEVLVDSHCPLGRSILLSPAPAALVSAQKTPHWWPLQMGRSKLQQILVGQ